MGTYMYHHADRFFIAAGDKEKGLELAKGLLGQETITDSGGRHFSWVHRDWHKRETLEDLLEDWRWVGHNDDAGNIVSLEFAGEKMGDEGMLFEAIAPVVKHGSYIEMSCDSDYDEYRWRWSFRNGEMEETHPTITWPEDEHNEDEPENG